MRFRNALLKFKVNGILALKYFSLFFISIHVFLHRSGSIFHYIPFCVLAIPVAKFERVGQCRVWMMNWKFIDLPPLFHVFINIHNNTHRSIEVLGIQNNWDPTNKSNAYWLRGVYCTLGFVKYSILMQNINWLCKKGKWFFNNFQIMF